LRGRDPRRHRIVALSVSHPISVASPISQPGPAAPARRPDNVGRGIALILCSGMLFAVMNASVKLLSGRLGPVEIGLFRQLFSLVPITLFMWHEGGFGMLRTRRPFGHLFRGLAGNGGMILFFLSLAHLPMADATAISFAAPLFMTALSVPLLGEFVGRHRWGAVALGFVGVIVMTRPSGAWFSHGAGAGALFGVLAALMSALMMITIRQLSRTERPVTIVFYFAGIGVLFFGCLLPFFWIMPTGWEWAGLLGIGTLGGFSQLAMTGAYRHAPASTLAPFGYVSIVFSTMFGFALWGELPGPRVLTGAAIVIASGLYIIFREARRQRHVVAKSLPGAS
jgi:drug/metabolite transporter (DMT)-like permease